MLRLLSESLPVPAGVYPYKWTLELEDGRKFRVYNLVRVDGRWKEVQAEESTRRVFVDELGVNYVYAFNDSGKTKDFRHMAGHEKLLVAQLERAINNRSHALLKREGTVRWEGRECVFVAGDGTEYLVYDAYELPPQRLLRPGSRTAGVRVFITEDPKAWRRSVQLRDAGDHQVNPATLTRQLQSANYYPGPEHESNDGEFFEMVGRRSLGSRA